MVLPPYPTRQQKTQWFKWLDQNAQGEFDFFCNGKKYRIQLSESYCFSYFVINFLLKDGKWSKPRIIEKLKLKFYLDKKEIHYNEYNN